MGPEETKDKNIGAKAVVQLTVEVEIGDRWTGDTTAAQIFKQAKDSAVQQLASALKPETHGKFRIVRSEVTGIFATKS